MRQLTYTIISETGSHDFDSNQDKALEFAKQLRIFGEGYIFIVKNKRTNKIIEIFERKSLSISRTLR